MSKVYIYCDGGFGNKFHILLGGLIISKATNREPMVIWPINNTNGLDFKNTFDTEITEYKDFTYQHGKEWIEKLNPINLVSWNPWGASSYEEHNPLNIHIPIDQFLKDKPDKDIFYYCGALCPWVDLNYIQPILDMVPLKKSIRNKANDFIKKNFGNEKFNGLHIRKTDNPYPTDEEYWIKVINEDPDIKHMKFFVCSDEKEVEEKFIRSCPNVRVYAKKFYQEMFSPELNNWKATFTDPLGHQISSNVKRGSESVYNALVDLLILSKSNILNSDHSSTFLKSAILLSGGNVNQKYRRW